MSDENVAESLFQKGDRVWEMEKGWGTVTGISRDTTDGYPVEVEFENGKADYYTLNGQRVVNRNRTLFFAEVPIPEEALKRPWMPKPGEWVAVSDTYATLAPNCSLRKFVRMHAGKFVCELATGDGTTLPWENAIPLSHFVKQNEEAQ